MIESSPQRVAIVNIGQLVTLGGPARPRAGAEMRELSVIADGAASGEFEVADVPLTAGCVCTAMMRFFHPQMIAQCAEKPGPELDQMIDFVLAGLAPRGKATNRKS